MKSYFPTFILNYILNVVGIFFYMVIGLVLCVAAIPFAYYKENHGTPGSVRYLKFLACNLVMDFVGAVLSIVLPLFSEDREGWCNNRNERGVEPRLFERLSWFQTPDNSLWGDNGWKTEHCVGLYQTYWGKCGWLLRNKCYGFNWTILAATVTGQVPITWSGEPNIDKNNPEHIGKQFKAQMGNYFQYKAMWKIPFIQRTFVLRIGWLLDTYVTYPDKYLTQPHALFLFAQRIGRI